MKVCRICLSKDGRLYPITSNGLRSLYDQVTGVLKLEMDVDKRLPQWVCTECGLRLMSYNKLRQKSLRAYNILCQILDRQTNITEEDINKIDRTKNGLQSNLGYAAQDFGIIPEYGIDSQETNRTDNKSQLKIKEFTIDSDGSEFEMGFKEEKDISNDYISENAVPDSENNLDLDNERFSDSASCSNLEDDETGDSLLIKTRQITKDFDVKKQVDKYMDSLIKKINNIRDKKAVRRPNITEKHINKIDKEKNILESNEVNNQKPDRIDIKQELNIEGITFDIDESDKSEKEIKAEKDFSNEFFSETVSDTENNLNLDDDSFSDSASLSNSNVLDTRDPTVPLKTKTKKKNLNIKKHVDLDIKKRVGKYMEALMGKINKITDKKAVLTKDEVMTSETNDSITLDDAVGRKRVKKSNTKVGLNSPYEIEDVFTVQTLSMEEQIAEFEGKKYSKNYTNAPFKCNICYKGYYNGKVFASHQIRHTDKFGGIECKICKIRLPRSKNYNQHIASHKTKYTCKQCDFISNLRSVAIKHRLIHKGKVYKCPHCTLQFVNQSSYLGHVRIQHVSQFVCKYCGFSFVNAKGVALHVGLKHALQRDSDTGSTDGPTCGRCNIKFVSDKALNTHLRISHPKNCDKKKRNECKDGQFASYICEICGANLHGGNAYRFHFEHFHPNVKSTKCPIPTKQIICEQCGRGFNNKSQMVEHSLLHTGVRPFECDHCNKTFRTKFYVRQHIVNVHMRRNCDYPKERFPCDTCGKEFSTANNRKRHMLIHTGLRPFICEICGSSFKTKSEVKAHTEHVHMKVPWPRKQARGSRQKT